MRTVHLCAVTPAHAAEIGEALEEAGIVWWVKPASSGFLSFLQRDSQIFVDRTKVEEATAIARRVLSQDGQA